MPVLMANYNSFLGGRCLLKPLQKNNPPSILVQAGFTLLELLVVVALLATLAGLAVTAYDSNSDDSIATQLAQSEMTELAKALRQFRRDVGNYPIVANPTDFKHLFVFVDADNDNVDDIQGYARFDPDTARGWRGPYLEQRGISCVDVNVAIDGIAAPANLIPYAKLDPFKQTNPSNLFAWFEANGTNTCTIPLQGKQGTPYLLINMPTVANPNPAQPRIVSAGPDGNYAGTNTVNACLPVAGSDDLVVCL